MAAAAPDGPLLSLVLQVLARATMQKKETKGIRNGKETVQTVLGCRQYDLMFRKPKDSTKTLLELINKLSSRIHNQHTKISIIAFLYFNSEPFEKENKAISFTIATEKQNKTKLRNKQPKK